MRKPLRVVMLPADQLANPAPPTYHEYRHAGATWCGRKFYITHREPGEERMEFVHRRHAERIGRACKSCTKSVRSRMERK